MLAARPPNKANVISTRHPRTFDALRWGIIRSMGDDPANGESGSGLTPAGPEPVGSPQEIMRHFGQKLCLAPTTSILASLLLLAGTLSLAARPQGSSSSLNLKAMLLRLDEMPIGWTAEGSGGGSSFGCLTNPLAPRGLKVTAHATASFGRRSGLPELSEGLATYKIPAKRAFARVDAVLTSCKHVMATSGGTTVRVTIGSMSFPHLGAESAAFYISVSASGITAEGYLIIARKGRILLGLTEGGLTSPDVRQFYRFVKLALSRLPR